MADGFVEASRWRDPAGARQSVSAAGAALPTPLPLAPAIGSTNATLVGRDDLGPTVARFRVAPDGGVPAFVPGQYVALGLAVGGRLLQRPYSTASPDGSTKELEFLIRRIPGGAFTPHLWALAVGDRLRVGRPKGVFALRPDDERAHLFLATGTGLAPFVSMVASMRARRSAAQATGPAPLPPTAPIVVVHGVSNVTELAYSERFHEWANQDPQLRYVPVISRPADPGNAGWAGATGRLDTAVDSIWAQSSLGAHDTVAYLCGNPDMIAACTARLTALGLGPGAIVSEQYWPVRTADVR